MKLLTIEAGMSESHNCLYTIIWNKLKLVVNEHRLERIKKLSNDK